MALEEKDFIYQSVQEKLSLLGGASEKSELGSLKRFAILLLFSLALNNFRIKSIVRQEISHCFFISSKLPASRTLTFKATS